MGRSLMLRQHAESSFEPVKKVSIPVLSRPNFAVENHIG